MSRPVNEALVDSLVKDLEGIDSCVVIGTVGMTVAEVTDLRTKLRAKDLRMRVVKNTLARRSFEQRGLHGLGDRLTGPSAVVFGADGALTISKVIVEEKKARKDKLVIHGAFSEGEVLDAAGVEALSRVPGRQELLGMVLGGLFGPVSGMAQNLDGLLTEMHGLITALSSKREEAGSGS